MPPRKRHGVSRPDAATFIHQVALGHETTQLNTPSQLTIMVRIDRCYALRQQVPKAYCNACWVAPRARPTAAPSGDIWNVPIACDHETSCDVGDTCPGHLTNSFIVALLANPPSGLIPTCSFTRSIRSSSGTVSGAVASNVGTVT